MELRIDLSDREEMEAAVSLLQLVLGETASLPTPSPAQVFGGAAPLAPASAACTADAALPPTAPEAPLAISPMPPVPAPLAPITFGMAAPSAPVPPASPANAVDLDKAGLPWDERIHAGTKTKITDGTWKKKKGVDAGLVASVEAELRARLGAATAPAMPAAPGVPPAPPSPTVAPVASLPPAAPAAPSASADPTTFEQLMPRVTPLVTSGALPPTALQQACTAVGLQSIVALQANPAYVPTVWATLKAQYPGVVQ